MQTAKFQQQGEHTVTVITTTDWLKSLHLIGSNWCQVM